MVIQRPMTGIWVHWLISRLYLLLVVIPDVPPLFLGAQFLPTVMGIIIVSKLPEWHTLVILALWREKKQECILQFKSSMCYIVKGIQ